MELQSSTYFPTNSSSLSTDTVELLTPVAASLAKLASSLRMTHPKSASVVETLLPDDRADLSPSQSVECKLAALIKGAAIPVSHFRHKKTCRRS